MQVVDVQLHYATDCKLDRFVNGPLIYKPVIHFLNTTVKWSCLETRLNFESWPNGLEVQQKVYKQPKLHESCINLLNKQPVL